jgi:predicted metal-dependent enzyme (double-stranded beta helix superfamily)
MHPVHETPALDTGRTDYHLDALVADVRLSIESATTLEELLRQLTRHLGRLAANQGFLERDFELPPDGDWGPRLLHRDAESGFVIGDWEPRLLHRDPEYGFIIDFFRFPPGERSPVHDHGAAWVVEAVYRGRLHSIDYERLDDDSVAGRGELRVVREVSIGPGDVIAIRPQAAHRIANLTDAVTVGLQIVERDLARLWRNAYDLEHGLVKRIRNGPTRFVRRRT